MSESRSRQTACLAGSRSDLQRNVCITKRGLGNLNVRRRDKVDCALNFNS